MHFCPYFPHSEKFGMGDLCAVPLNIFEFCESQRDERRVLLMGINEFLNWEKFDVRGLHIMLFSICQLHENCSISDYLSYGHTWSHVCLILFVCVRNTLVKCACIIIEYTVCNIILFWQETWQCLYHHSRLITKDGMACVIHFMPEHSVYESGCSSFPWVLFSILLPLALHP